MEHKWIGLGTAEFSQDQALEWATLEGTTAAPLLLHVTRVVCAICDQGFMEAVAGCPGMQNPPGHHWVSLMTLAMTQEDAARWADHRQGGRVEHHVPVTPSA